MKKVMSYEAHPSYRLKMISYLVLNSKECCNTFYFIFLLCKIHFSLSYMMILAKVLLYDSIYATVQNLKMHSPLLQDKVLSSQWHSKSFST